MRRKQKPLHVIKEFFPIFFWRKCDLCKEEFREECGWKVHFQTITRIICKQCAPSWRDVEKLALTWGERGICRPTLRLTRMIDNASVPPNVSPGIKPPSPKYPKCPEKGVEY